MKRPAGDRGGRDNRTGSGHDNRPSPFLPLVGALRLQKRATLYRPSWAPLAPSVVWCRGCLAQHRARLVVIRHKIWRRIQCRERQVRAHLPCLEVPVLAVVMYDDVCMYVDGREGCDSVKVRERMITQSESMVPRTRSK